MSEAGPDGSGASGDARVPAARIAGLIVTASDDELVIFDEAPQHIHHLNAVSAAVWRLCDGRRTVAEVAAEATATLDAKVDAEAVTIALGKLDEARLLAGPAIVPRMSRRTFGRRAAIVAPAVVSITAPLASASASSCWGNGRVDQISCQVNKADANGRCCERFIAPFGDGFCGEVSPGQYDCIVPNAALRWFGGG